MARCLRVCPGCSRHVRTEESACPFCGADVSDGVCAGGGAATDGRPLGRAAIVFASMTAIAACGKTTGGPKETEHMNVAPAYGVAPPNTMVEPSPVPPPEPVIGTPQALDAGADAGKADAGKAEAHKADAGARPKR
jgi:hypothetical protein